MKRILSTVIIGAVAVVAAAGYSSAAESWSVDPVHSSVMFRIKHNNVAPFFGRFNGKTGTVVFDEANPANSSISITVDPATVDTGNEKRNGHIMSPDFLSAKEFPEMSFKSTSVSKSADGTLKVVGDLSVHGVTKSTTLKVSHTSSSGMKGEQLHGFYTEFTIKRADFNIGASFPDTALSEEVTMYISLECKKP